MASARQRRRKHARRVHHRHTQRARLRAALDSAPRVFTMGELRRHMSERGFEQDPHGGWRAVRQGGWVTTERDLGDHMTEVVMEPALKRRRGPSWSGISARRKAKKRRK